MLTLLQRDGVSRGGVLATGTVVVITDGKDSSNGSLNTGVLNNTVNQVLTVGISNDVDHEDLDRIGRDGSFLAPTADQWAEAFAEISTRAEQCRSLRRAKTNPDNAFEEMTCQLPARYEDTCNSSTAKARCEDGMLCKGTCEALKRDLQSCSSSSECLSLNCQQSGGGNICMSAGECFWSWNDALGG